MVHAFRQGIMSGPFSDSLIRNWARTFGEIRQQVVAHIAAEEAVIVKRESSYTGQTKPREGGLAQPMRVHEVVTEKGQSPGKHLMHRERTKLGRRRRTTCLSNPSSKCLARSC